MNKLLEILSAESLAQAKSLAARREVIDQLREYESASAKLAELEEMCEQLEGEIADLETSKSVLEKLDHRQLLAATEAFIVLYATHVKKLAPEGLKKLQETFLHANNHILGGIDMWREPGSAIALVRAPAMERIFKNLVEPIWSEIVAGLKSREDIVMKRAKPESAKLEGANHEQ